MNPTQEAYVVNGWNAAKQPPHWVAELVCGAIGATFAIYSFIGWVFVSFGWVTPAATFTACGVLGLLFGVYMAAETIRENRQKT